jgi:hypothetical protein
MGTMQPWTDALREAGRPVRDGACLAAANGLPASSRAMYDAILATVAYADVFDFAVTDAEVHRNLIGFASQPAQTRSALADLLADGVLTRVGGHVVLRRREDLVALRRDRDERARALWPSARAIGRILGSFPFVRMVAVTGSLAAGNPDPGADLDYLIVVRPGRLWLARALAVGLVRVARFFGVEICPNYLLTTRHLRIEHHDLYTAHELLLAVPVAGAATYRQLRAQNLWAARWLPNRFREQPAILPESALGGLLRRAGELGLGRRIGDCLEAREFRRKQGRLRARGEAASFTADACEGHFGRHRRRVLSAFEERCRRLGVIVPGGEP